MCIVHCSRGQVHDLHLTAIRPVALAALLKSSSQDLSLFRLHTLHSIYHGKLSSKHHGEHTSSFSALVGLLAERKLLNMPITKVVIKSSTISARGIDKLRRLAVIDWDSCEEWLTRTRRKHLQKLYLEVVARISQLRNAPPIQISIY